MVVLHLLDADDTGLIGKGFGNHILTAAMAVASHLGGERLHLLTTTTEPFFVRRGLVASNRTSGPLRSGESVSSWTPARRRPNI